MIVTMHFMKLSATNRLHYTIFLTRNTSNLIPLCHPLPLDKVQIDIRLDNNIVLISCECRVTHKTGVEMEVSAAKLGNKLYIPNPTSQILS